MFLGSGQDAKCAGCGMTLLAVQMTVQRPTPKQELLNKLAELEPGASERYLAAIPSEELANLRLQVQRGFARIDELTKQNTELRLQLHDAERREHELERKLEAATLPPTVT